MVLGCETHCESRDEGRDTKDSHIASNLNTSVEGRLVGYGGAFGFEVQVVHFGSTFEVVHTGHKQFLVDE